MIPKRGDFLDQIFRENKDGETARNIGAGEGNRTLVFSLEGCCSTIELHPQRINHEKSGFVPTSVPISFLGFDYSRIGAGSTSASLSSFLVHKRARPSWVETEINEHQEKLIANRRLAG